MRLWSRLSVCALVVGALVGGGLQPAAGVEKGKVTRSKRFDVRQTAVLRLDGTWKLESMSQSVKTLNGSGEVLRSVPLSLMTNLSGDNNGFACVNNRNRRRLTIYRPIPMTTAPNPQVDAQFMWHPYRYDRARFLAGARFTRQWLVCSVGGSDPKNGWRLYWSGSGQAWANKERTRRIGSRWKDERTPEDYTIGLKFEVGRGPVKISGSISQTPTDKVTGNWSGIGKHDRFWRNASHGWWQNDCLPPGPCWTWSGSAGFQGAVSEALWEFSMRRKRGFRLSMQPHLHTYCSNKFSGCP